MMRYLPILIVLFGYGIWGRMVWKREKGTEGTGFWDSALRYTIAHTGLLRRIRRVPGAKDLTRLLPWKRREDAAADFVCRAGNLLIGGCVLLTVFAGLAAEGKEEMEPGPVYREGEGWYLGRGEPGGEESIVDLSGMMDGETIAFQAAVPNRKATGEEEEALFKMAEEYITRVWLGTNSGADEIREDLNLPDGIPGTGITVEWEREDASLLSERGVVWNRGLPADGVLTEITAVIRFDGCERRLIFPLRILPEAADPGEESRLLLEEYLQEEALGDPYEEEVRLPDEIGGREVVWQPQEQGGVPVIFGFLLLAAAMPVLFRAKLLEDMKRRSIQLDADYPDLINKLSLYLGAGMSVRTAWGRIAAEYRESLEQGRNRRGRRYAYEEMRLTWNELCIGVPEEEAFERFGQRIGEISYIRFGTLLAQNVRKGGRRLLELLEAEEAQAFARRKENARREGEKAGTRLLIPMIGMLVIVIAVIMIPAVWSM